MNESKTMKELHAIREKNFERMKKMSVKVGDKVVFSRYGYDEVKLDGVEYYILKEENILAIIR
jgi:co-chaperonin GroES (HSP10)